MSANSLPVFVISLARAAERRTDMIRRLEAADIRHEIVDAVDGVALNRAEIADRFDPDYNVKAMGRPMGDGEIGCYLSHYRLWERIAAEEIPLAVVLEDDAQLESDFMQVAADVASCEWEWDVVVLSRSERKGGSRFLSPVSGGRQLVLQQRHPWTTVAYMVSLSGAKKLQDYLHRIRMPIDSAWRHWWRWGGRFYFVRPGAAKGDQDDSWISKVGQETDTDKWTKMTVLDVAVKSAIAKKERWERFWHFHFHRPQKRRRNG